LTVLGQPANEDEWRGWWVFSAASSSRGRGLKDEVVLVLVVALAKALVVVLVLEMQMVLRFNHVRRLLRTVLFVMHCNGVGGLSGT
jgi:hypothetical protein